MTRSVGDRPMWYRLEGTTPVPCSLSQLAESDMGKSVKQTLIAGDKIRISTVFLGLDHAFVGEPMLFETLVFGGRSDGLQARCSTWADAERMHERILSMVRKVEGTVWQRIILRLKASF